MHKHGSKERQKITEWIGKKAARNESPLPNKSVTAALLYKEKQDVQSDQGIRDQWNSSARRIIITDWEHKICLLLARLDLSQLHVKTSPAFLKESGLLATNIYLQPKEKRPTSPLELSGAFLALRKRWLGTKSQEKADNCA